MPVQYFGLYDIMPVCQDICPYGNLLAHYPLYEEIPAM
jgi:hypothetical protein